MNDNKIIKLQPQPAGEKLQPKPPTKRTPKPKDAPWEAPKFYNHTDLGNARRMVDAFGQDIMYVNTWDAWYLWSGGRWVNDDTEEIVRIAKRTVQRMYKDAARLTDDDKRQDLIKFALASESRKRLSDMITLARSEEGIGQSDKALNQNHMLLNCTNGTIDLTTGEIRPHNRADRITKQIPVAYNPAALCPTWIEFLNTIMLGDQGMIDFLQRAIGYTLTGDVREQALFFMYGSGSNGKSTFINAIYGLLGEYGMKAPTEMIMQKYGSPGIPNDIAKLPGQRLVVVAELEEGRKLAESTVKDMTGGDPMTARFMRGEWFDFMPTHKLWMYGNHKPVITGTDNGIWRRIHLIPFLQQFAEHEKDKAMLAKLRAEYEGILAWAVQGCLLWQKDGLTSPAQVVEATANYRSEMDTLQRFIQERCYVDSAVSVRFSDLRGAYEQWCAQNGATAEGGRKFGNSLTDRGFAAFNGHSNVAMRRGIALLVGE